MDSATQEKLAELQTIEQNLQKFLSQKQQFQTQIVEIESALKESKDASETHKIIGNIMVRVDKDKLVEDLNSKKEMISIRLNSIEKQEKKLRLEADELHKQIMEKSNK